MATKEDLKNKLFIAQKNISNFQVPIPEPITTKDEPPKKIIPPEKIQQIKELIANKTAEELSPILHDFITEMVNEIAVKPFQAEIASLKERINKLEQSNRIIIAG